MSSVLYNRTGFKQHRLLLLNINLVQLHLMEGSSMAVYVKLSKTPVVLRGLHAK